MLEAAGVTSIKSSTKVRDLPWLQKEKLPTRGFRASQISRPEVIWQDTQSAISIFHQSWSFYQKLNYFLNLLYLIFKKG